ncbi:MAG: hypothetical protein Q9204_005637 [Flavoplaca sp. TL-2023a]
MGLRILSKAYTKASWAVDDSWAVVGLIALFALITAEFWGNLVRQSNSLAIADFKPQSLYMLHQLYALSITATKLSILYLYRRIFAVRTFKQISFAVAAICVSWWAAFTVTALFPCYPVKKMWQHQIKGHCYNFKTFFLASGVVDVLLDAIILSLPIKMISRLQMPYKRKVMLCFVFLIGGLAFFGTRRPSRKATDQHPLKHCDNLTGPAEEEQRSRETIAGRSTGGHGETEWEAYPTTVEKTVQIV